MAKQKKKRNKIYTGPDAAMTRPSVTRVQAVSRSRPAQWWYDRKRVIKPVAIIVAIVAVVVWLTAELISIFVGA